VVEQTPPSTPATGDRTEAPLTGAIVKQAEPGAPPQFSEAEHAQAGTAAGAQAAVQPREPETKQAESDALPQVAETKDTSPAPDMTAPPEPAESLARVPEVQQAEIPAQPHEATAQLTEGRVETEAGTEAAAPVTAEAVAPPALLGQVKLKKGWSFAKRQDVYGRRNKAVFDAMAKANPGLTSIFDAGPGTVVNFPAVAAPALPEGMVLLSLMRADNLAQALDYVVDRSTEQMPLRLFATFSPARGTRLDVILLRAFPNPEQAEQAKSALPPELAAQASVLTGFSHDTVFYSLLPPEIVPPEPASPVGTNAPPAPARPRPRSQPVKQAAPAPQQPLAPSPDRTPTPYVPGENQN
jgi:phage tail protein X